MMAKTTFVFHREWFDAYKAYPDDLRTRIYDAIVKYAFEGVVPDYSDPVRMAFDVIRQALDKDNEKYNDIIEKRREAGRRGAEKTNGKKRQMSAKTANAEFVRQNRQSSANAADNDNDIIYNDNIIINPLTPLEGERKETKKVGVNDIPEEFSYLTPAVERYLQYRHERKDKAYKPIGFKAMLSKLARLSNADADTALAIVEQTIANNWAGLFEIKNNNNGTNNQSGAASRAERKRQAGVDAIHNLLATC